MRWYMYTSTAPGNPRRFSGHLVGESIRKFLLTLWNTYSFFVTYANLDGWVSRSRWQNPRIQNGQNPIDRWALSQVQALVNEVTTKLEALRGDRRRPCQSRTSPTCSPTGTCAATAAASGRARRTPTSRPPTATLHACLVTVAKLLAPFAPFVSEEIYRNLVAERDADAPQSVHLADWPVVDESLVNATLDRDMGVLIQVVELGRSARSESGLKVRQPLAEMLVHVPGAVEQAALTGFMDELRDELNVKAVRFLEASSGLVEYRFKPNLPVVGRKYGKMVPALKNALQQITGAQAQDIAAAAKAGETFTLEVDGQTLELTAEEILIESSSPEGFAVAEEGGYVVALNTEISEELRREGLARDLVRNIQDARKDAGLQISDRIRLSLEMPADLAAAVTPHVEYLRTETLADDIAFASAPAGAYTANAELGEAGIVIGIVKAS